MANWIKLQDERPIENGMYLVIWSEPYQEKTKMKTEFFLSGEWMSGEVNGANEILYWSRLPLNPDDLQEYREKKMKERGL